MASIASYNLDILLSKASDYVRWDPDPITKSQVQSLIESKSINELTNMLTKRIQFGTAGLRAAMGPGYHRMNDLVILQTSQGLLKYLESYLPNAKNMGIVVGYDHRRSGSISSHGLANTTAAVFRSQGFKVYMLDQLVATPFVPFAIQHFGCAAGIMVTASHNPKQDNGYKVYWGNGAQIIPPHDVNIATFIEDNLEPWQDYSEYLSKVDSDPLVVKVTEEVSQKYFQAIKKMSGRASEKNAASSVKVAYTAMHGVGRKWIESAFRIFNHPALNIVQVQAEPDPDFSTVSFPNPEEKGALNEALKFADENSCTLIIANDPDADRLAAAEKQSDGTWRMFTGNEIGVILGYWLILQWKANNPDACTPAAVLASIVSSRMLKTIAIKEGIAYHDTLTGFKWLGNRSQQLRQAGTPVIFSYEEALGYCCGDVLSDKDGISAASIFVEMAAALADGWTEGGGEASGAPSTISQLFHHCSQKYGEFVSYNSYIVCHDPKKTDEIFARLRGEGSAGYWTSCCGQSIVAIQDVTKGYDSTSADHSSSLPCTPESHMIMYEFDNGVTITLRTSGTEPKIKFYTEIAGKPGQEREALKTLLTSFVDSVVNEMLEPSKHGLQWA